ncbi:sugar phosphate nucleotidyltransferase [Ruminococcus albus]|uniref:Mannose-1-phosphate guanylyltransferase n=1 Tax=Ruminococcus albus (strain ATCC 27210 / DSM 20455 / JCM 14654 / NCDO 2250 / 7) TaxID=697329 RepID=E6UEK2_RUMA7|nr:sugar phosphate nucleotidyltransferase [Ruminococcus albus]ADU20957.1 Mannose-1-phosphate guanylyltransferase [Ruminococcus albus 7 = DSM 20455]
MKIILLSGGSGKRLWPLSNDVQSKQFIRLFKNDDGCYESMLQRVYRQISSVSGAGITIATSRSQVSAIKNQLNDKVSICIEPCRRDTFPAIALAAEFLHDVKDTDRDECVIVCPVDPYVDDSYYECVRSLEAHVQKGDTALTLMGIEPTYPSDKYGYIIPDEKAEVSLVKSFKEKPDKKTAEEYLKKGALWNAGVFAFKLGYLIDKVHEITGYTGYNELLENYEKLEKISFDYAVVEKESSIKAVRYSGDWKDVGTWNMMAEVMADATKGDVTLDDTCENTQVVNELSIPVLCMGCRDMVIAVSGDGILVSDKERSGYMKPYVEKIAGEAHFAEKSWGTYTVMDSEAEALTVKIKLYAGNNMNYHSHKNRSEVWTVLSGEGRFIIDGIERVVGPGDTVSAKAGVKHMIIADTDMSIIEVQTGKDIDRKDKTVYECEYGKGNKE